MVRAWFSWPCDAAAQHGRPRGNAPQSHPACFGVLLLSVTACVVVAEETPETKSVIMTSLGVFMNRAEELKAALKKAGR